MEIMDSIRAALKELIIPELDKIKEENTQIKATLELTNKRLDDINLHLIDQSRRIDETNKRIDAVRSELTQKIEKVHSELTQKIEKVHSDLIQRMDDVRSEQTHKIDEAHSDLTFRMDGINQRIDKTNERMNHLYQAIVRREEHDKLEDRVIYLEHEVQEMKMKLPV